MTKCEYQELVEFLGKELGRIDERFERIDERFERIDERFDGIEDRLVRVEIGVESSRNDLRAGAARVTALDQKVDREIGSLRDEMRARFDDQFDDQEEPIRITHGDLSRRIARLEERV